MSKQAQVGQTKAHAPQPRHRRLCSLHRGESHSLARCAWMSRASKAASTLATGMVWASARSGATHPIANAIHASPFGVRTSAQYPPLSSGVRNTSLPRMSSGPEPSAEQKHEASALVHAIETTVSFSRRALKKLSRESQLNTASSAANARASQGRVPKSTVGGGSGVGVVTETSLPLVRYSRSFSTFGKTTPFA